MAKHLQINIEIWQFLLLFFPLTSLRAIKTLENHTSFFIFYFSLFGETSPLKKRLWVLGKLAPTLVSMVKIPKSF